MKIRLKNKAASAQNKYKSNEFTYEFFIVQRDDELIFLSKSGKELANVTITPEEDDNGNAMGEETIRESGFILQFRSYDSLSRVAYSYLPLEKKE